MPLCGATGCGTCAIVSTPSTAGEIAGEFPSITNTGAGTAESPFDIQLNAGWADEVAALHERESRHGCSLRRAANQSATGSTAVTVSWDTEDADTDGYITVTSSTITIPAGLGGLYAVQVRAIGAASWTADTWIEIRVNGTTKRVEYIPVSSSSTSLTATWFGLLAAADTVDVRARNAGATQNFTAELELYRVAS